MLQGFFQPRMYMLAGQLVFCQLMREFPIKAFSRIVATHRAQHKVKDFSCLDQFYVMAYAQLTGRDSLRSIELNLRQERAQWYHMGLRCKGISRNTLAHANATRPWQVFAELAQHLIGTARVLYAGDKLNGPLLGKLKATVYALDSTTIDLCLSLFAWAPFRTTKAAVKLHTLLDLRGSIPSFIHISNGKMHDVKMLDILVDQGLIEAGAFYVMDKAYVDFKRLYTLECAKAYFVTRAKRNMQCRVVQPQPFTVNTGVTADQWVQLTGLLPSQRYPTHLRRICYTDPESGKALVFLTNNMTLAASTICALYKSRWRVELFFKWIKQHLHIQRFFGTSENALKTQIWCAIATYVLVAITKKKLNLPHTLHDILRQLDLNMFKTTPITQLLGMHETAQCESDGLIQQSLFSTLGH
jgi:Transposase DDE domain/Domain of unknown function (DUF4372)